MSEDTKLRDDLARDRTAMANERTLLAYGRTSLGLLGLAVVIFKFTDPESAMIWGSLSLTAAGFVFFWGLRSYRMVNARMQGIASDSHTPAFADLD